MNCFVFQLWTSSLSNVFLVLVWTSWRETSEIMKNNSTNLDSVSGTCAVSETQKGAGDEIGEICNLYIKLNYYCKYSNIWWDISQRSLVPTCFNMLMRLSCVSVQLRVTLWCIVMPCVPVRNLVHLCQLVLLLACEVAVFWAYTTWYCPWLWIRSVYYWDFRLTLRVDLGWRNNSLWFSSVNGYVLSC